MNTILYHAGCADGFCAAWLCYQVWPEADFIPVNYGDDPPDVTGKSVLIADFSFKREVLERMNEQATTLVVLDHHKTAEEELRDLDYCWFDITKSGARMTWEYLYRKFESFMKSPKYKLQRPHWLVRYTEDRDLWKWELKDSKVINAAIRSYPFDFEVWNQLASLFDSMKAEGQAILRYQQTIVDNHVKQATETTLDGHKVLMVNATTLISEIAGKLAENRPFGVCYFIRDGKQQFSLRSREGGIDVAEIAKRHGGGGHKKAAGFEVSIP